jgi:hypothetical protein
MRIQIYYMSKRYKGKNKAYFDLLDTQTRKHKLLLLQEIMNKNYIIKIFVNRSRSRIIIKRANKKREKNDIQVKFHNAFIYFKFK